MRRLSRSADRAGDRPCARGAFTVIELLVVMAIILVLAGLVLATSSYVHNKGARSRAEAEIAAISAALENYKADNGVYPSDGASDGLDTRAASPNPSNYQTVGATLYAKITGDTNGDGQADAGASSYLGLKPNQVGGSANTTFVKDPFGNSYGYSTAGQVGAGAGYNPTFDLWSTAGGTTDADKTGWIKNW